MFRSKRACENRTREPNKKTFMKNNSVFENIHEIKKHITDNFIPPQPYLDCNRKNCIKPPDEIATLALSKIAGKPYNARNNTNCLSRIMLTIDYLLFNFNRSIYVSIRNKKVHMFVVMRIKTAKNPFVTFLKPLSTKTRQDIKSHLELLQKEDTDPEYNPVESWSVMNCLIGNVIKVKRKEQTGYELGYTHHEMKRLFNAVCSMYAIPDCDFFVNVYDQVVLRKDLTMPFWTITDGRRVPLPFADRYAKKGLCHIFSMSTRPDHADVPLVFPDDVLRLYKSYGIPRCSNPYIDEPNYELVWENKVKKAVFRGTATGCGWTPETNQRLALIYQAESRWSKNPRYNRLFDVALTGAEEIRFKKYKNEPVRFYVDPRVKQTPERAMNLVEQSRFKYLLYIEGNVVAYRLSAMFGMGSVVVYVKGMYQPWFYGMLKHKHNCIVVSDVKDLPEAILWCTKNDIKCKEIARRGLEMYQTLFSKKGTLGYVAWSLRQFALVADKSEDQK
jgi:hypothetical protein